MKHNIVFLLCNCGKGSGSFSIQKLSSICDHSNNCFVVVIERELFLFIADVARVAFRASFSYQE